MLHMWYRCRRSCFGKFTEAEKEMILHNINTLGRDGKVAQDAYLCGLISAVQPKCRRPRKGVSSATRAFTYIYKVKCGKETAWAHGSLCTCKMRLDLRMYYLFLMQLFQLLQ